MKEYKKFISIFIIAFISGINISNEQTKIQDVQKALQEVAYSYYMRGKDIQYNSHKVHFFFSRRSHISKCKLYGLFRFYKKCLS